LSTGRGRRAATAGAIDRRVRGAPAWDRRASVL